MPGQSEALSPRDRFLQAAEKELAAFEQREREFRKKERKERPAQLQLPIEKPGLKPSCGAASLAGTNECQPHPIERRDTLPTSWPWLSMTATLRRFPVAD